MNLSICLTKQTRVEFPQYGELRPLIGLDRVVSARLKSQNARCIPPPTDTVRQMKLAAYLEFSLSVLLPTSAVFGRCSVVLPPCRKGTKPVGEKSSLRAHTVTDMFPSLWRNQHLSSR